MRIFSLCFVSRGMTFTKNMRSFFHDCHGLYILTFVVTTYFVVLLYLQRPGVYVQCPCLVEIKTEERVERYLSSLMNERNPTTNRTTAEEAESEHPSLPVRFLTEVEAEGRRCSSVPGLFDIKHRNTLWQEAQVGSSTFLLFSAFIDYRDEREGPLVRILAMSNSASPATPTCHLYDPLNITRNPVATRAIRVDYIHWQEPKSDEWHPLLITCRAGSALGLMPEVVSLVGYPCSPPSNALKVWHYERGAPKRAMALCHKFLFSPNRDFSFRLIEWLESARAWGIDCVSLYESASHPNVKKVLEYYKELNFVKLIPWTNPGDQPNVPSLFRALYDTQRYVLFTDENIPYTDCFLRHIGTHRYVGIWDMDEFVFPVDSPSIPDMVDAALANWKQSHKDSPSSQAPASYLARSSYFFDDVVHPDMTDSDALKELLSSHDFPRPLDGLVSDAEMFQTYFPMLSHTIRSVKFSPPGVFTKSIHDTSRALALHAHFALFTLEGPVDREKDLYHLYPSSEAFLGHFRSKCQGEEQTDCEQNFRPHLTLDKTLWHRSSQVISNVLKVIADLGLA